MVLRHDRKFYVQFVLFFVLFFFVITYMVTHKDTLAKEWEVLSEGSALFLKTTTYHSLNLSDGEQGFDRETYDIEFLVFKQVNTIRERNGLNPLTWDPVLAEIARQHSLDMVERSYFNHTNPDGQNPDARAKEARYKGVITYKREAFEGIGENLGLMPKGVVEDVGVIITTEDVASAMVLRWMLSEPHRENILEETYQFTGVGVAYNGDGKYYLTQNFQ